MTKRNVDEAIASLARHQHGAFSLRQAMDLGATDSMRRARIGSGQWARVDHGVLILPSHPHTWEQRLMAATLGNRGAVVWGKPAGALLGMDGCRRGRPIIAVPPGGDRRSNLAEVHESRFIRATKVEHIPVANAVVTWFALVTAPNATRDFADAALESGLRLKLFSVGDLTNHFVLLARHRWPRLALARELIERRDGTYVPSSSELERRLYGAVDIPEFAPFVRQATFPWRPEDPETVDGLMLRGDMLIEGDGRAWHQRVRDFERDRRRDNEALAHGYLPVRFSWTDLHDVEDTRATVRAIQRWSLARGKPAA